MFRIARLLVLFLLLPFCSHAQADSSHLRVSLLTVGPGSEIWATFGHAGIRVTDSLNGVDVVYNYGTFEFGEGFELQFMRGKLLYYISYEKFPDFVGTYIAEQRRVWEQEILLSTQQKQQLYTFLIENAKTENRYYKYDFLYDNCATRIRDVFPKTFGAEFRFGPTLPQGSRLTFRQIINVYLAPQPWERYGINLLLGREMDRRMTDKDAMFLPDYLRAGIGHATVRGQKVAAEPAVLLDIDPQLPHYDVDVPMLVMLALAVLTILGLSVPRLRWLGRAMSALLLFITGLLGCLMLFMWLGTDHQACQHNWNVLWALPTNLALLVIRKRGRDRYALVAIILLLLALVLHVLHIQELPLAQLWPLLLALLYIYGMIYRHRNHSAVV